MGIYIQSILPGRQSGLQGRDYRLGTCAPALVHRNRRLPPVTASPCRPPQGLHSPRGTLASKRPQPLHPERHLLHYDGVSGLAYPVLFMPPSTAGRYVSLRIDGRAECLNFAEVQVYGAPLQLLSQGKPASLSSQHPAFPAGNANDGDLKNFAHTSCALDGAGPWWGVDLGGARHAGAGGS